MGFFPTSHSEEVHKLATFETPGRAIENLQELTCSWGICGGWAIDLWINSVSRVHTDVDFAILRKDHSEVLSHFTAAGWSTATAHQGTLTPCSADQTIAPPIHCIWCTKEGANPPFIELLLNESENGEFVYRRCPEVRIPLDRTFINSKSGIPILAPEIVLLYKSKDYLAPRNDHDFARAVGTLDQTRLRWLREALRIISPTHPWLDQL